MIIIGCDFHTRFQQIAMLDPATARLWNAGWSMKTVRRKDFTPHFQVQLVWV